jgi:phosphate transport system substrate-binding protein
MKSWNIVLPAIAVLLLAACDKSAPPTPDKSPAPAASAATTQPTIGTVQASGSSALQPLVNAAKEKFEATHKGISVEVSAGGSKKGLADVASGAVQIGNSDIFAAPDQQAQLVDHRVAVVGFAAMANKGPFNEKVTALSMQDLAKIISYLALSFADPDLLVLGLKTDAGLVQPNAASITSGQYPIWSYEHMYTKGPPTGAAKEFLDYVTSPDFQEHVLPTVKGFIPVTQMKVSRDKD